MITPKYDGFFSCVCNDFLAAAPVDVTIPEIEELGLTHFVTIGLERSASYFPCYLDKLYACKLIFLVHVCILILVFTYRCAYEILAISRRVDCCSNFVYFLFLRRKGSLACFSLISRKVVQEVQKG
jgi:hypothetical protein